MKSTYVVLSDNTENPQRPIDQLSAEVSNSENVLKLLDHENWRMLICLCGQSCSNFSYSEYEL